MPIDQQAYLFKNILIFQPQRGRRYEFFKKQQNISKAMAYDSTSLYCTDIYTLPILISDKNG